MKQEKTIYSHVSRQAIHIATMTVLMLVIFSAASNKTISAESEDYHLADLPMEIRGYAAPPVVNIAWDASGSMRWTIFTEDDLYDPYGGNRYAYVFPESEYYYTSGDYARVIPESMRDHWRVTSGSHNYMFYSPESDYKPWPRWNNLDPDPFDHENKGYDNNFKGLPFHADTDTPRQHPTKDSYGTFDLNAPYYNFDVGTEEGESFEDLGIVIDNNDTVNSMDYFIIDNGDPGYSLEDADGPISGYTLDNSDSYNDDYDRVYDDYETLPYTATYTFDLVDSGSYGVFVRWYEYYRRSEEVEIRIDGNPVDSVNQKNSPRNEAGADYFMEGVYWYKVGDYELEAGTGSAVIEFYYDGSGGESFSSDAVLLEPNFEATGPALSFSTTGPWLTSTNDSDAYADTFLYTNASGTNFTATWTVNNLDPSKTYDVYAWWVDRSQSGTSALRSTAVDYIIDHANGSETVTVNQRLPGRQWRQLASDLSFGSSGSVTLDHTPTDTHTDRACADAVLFIESGLYSEGLITFAHYFTQNEEGDVFLVDLNNDFTYYKAVLSEDGITVDHLILLTEEEAQDAGIVTGRSYEDERQNFADWYQFYRRRYFTGIAAAGQFIDGWSNVFIRLASFPKSNHNLYRQVSAIDMTIDTLYKEGEDTYFDETDAFLHDLYDMPHPTGATPLPEAMIEAGKFFDDGVGWSDLHGQSPYRIYSNNTLLPFFFREYGGECQHSFNIVMTDGQWNVDLKQSDKVGNIDGDSTLDFYVAAHADEYSNTVADIAKYYYNKDLKPEASQEDRWLRNFVPTAPHEPSDATHQRMITYGISFGVPGKYTDEQRQRFSESLRYGHEPGDSDWEGWPEPSSSGIPANIDDLWHATINSYGEFFSANRPEKLIESMDRIKQDILERIGTAAAVTTSTVRLEVGTKIFHGQYDSNRWSGDLFAREVDVDTGLIKESEDDPDSWSAADELDNKSAEERVIFTYDGSKGTAFTYNSLTSTQQDLLGNDSDMVDYLRGDRSLEQQNGGPFRSRDSKLGDIVHSEPAYHNGAVYVGANDGMLHAFDAETGEELFAYVPGIVFENLGKLASPGYNYQFFVNGSPTVRRAGETRMLVCGLNYGGKGYFALDVTNVETTSESDAASIVKWEYTAENDDDLGYSYSKPLIMKTKAAGWVAAFGNGYNSVNGNAVLHIVDLETGASVKKFDTGEGPENGIVGDVDAIDVDYDGYADFAYAGDLQGNLWKFDLRGEDTDDWGIAYNGNAMFTAKNADGEGQPITSKPSIMRHCEGPGFLVAFGTGKFDSELDFGNTETQSVYGIWDWQAAWETYFPEENADNKYYGTFQTDRSLSNMFGDLQNLTLLQQEKKPEVTHEGGKEYFTFTDNEIEWYDPVNELGEHVGWYLDLLPESGERVTINPRIRDGHVRLVTHVPSESPCQSGGHSVSYALNACTGGAPSSPQFFDEDGEPVMVNGEYAGGVELDHMASGQTFLGDKLFTDPDEPPIQTSERESGMTYWHEW